MWCLTNTLKSILMHFVPRLGARSQQGYGDDEQRRIGAKGAELVQFIGETPH
jgi:hypothetical protein